MESDDIRSDRRGQRVACDQHSERPELGVQIAVDLIHVGAIECLHVLQLEYDLPGAESLPQVGEERCLSVVVEDDVTDANTLHGPDLALGKLKPGVEPRREQADGKTTVVPVHHVDPATWEIPGFDHPLSQL